MDAFGHLYGLSMPECDVFEKFRSLMVLVIARTSSIQKFSVDNSTHKHKVNIILF